MESSSDYLSVFRKENKNTLLFLSVLIVFILLYIFYIKCHSVEPFDSSYLPYLKSFYSNNEIYTPLSFSTKRVFMHSRLDKEYPCEHCLPQLNRLNSYLQKYNMRSVTRIYDKAFDNKKDYPIFVKLDLDKSGEKVLCVSNRPDINIIDWYINAQSTNYSTIIYLNK